MSENALYKIIFDEIQYITIDDWTNQQMDEMASAVVEILKRNILILKEFIEEKEEQSQRPRRKG